MSSIDWPMQIRGEAGLPQAKGKPDLNRQNWLKALEQAGLRDALRATRQFVSPEASEPLAERGSFDAPSLRPERGEQAEEYRVAPGARGVSQAAGGQVGSTVVPAPARGDKNGAPAYGNFSPFAGFPGASAGPASIEQAEGSQAAKPSPPATPSQKNWLARNIAVLPSGSGIEIWIRDSALAESGLAALLSGLRSAMAELGTSLVGVSLNGKPLHPRAQEKLSERKSKEG